MSPERLLRWYPEPYRSERGPEILGVLMDAGGPTGRERRALILNGLRMRTGADRPSTTWDSWRAALRTAAIMWLVINSVYALTGLLSPDIDFGPVLAGQILLGAAAIAAIIGNRFTVALVATAVSIGLDQLPKTGSWIGGWHLLPLVVVALAPLAGRGPVSVPRSLNLLAALALVPAGLMLTSMVVHHAVWANASRAFWWYFIAAAVLWAVVDPRITLTAGLVLVCDVVEKIWVAVTIGYGSGWYWIVLPVAIAAIMPVLGVTTGTIAAHRRARL